MLYLFVKIEKSFWQKDCKYVRYTLWITNIQQHQKTPNVNYGPSLRFLLIWKDFWDQHQPTKLKPTNTQSHKSSFLGGGDFRRLSLSLFLFLLVLLLCFALPYSRRKTHFSELGFCCCFCVEQMLKAKAKTKQLLLIRVVKVVELEAKHKYRD